MILILSILFRVEAGRVEIRNDVKYYLDGVRIEAGDFTIRGENGWMKGNRFFLKGGIEIKGKKTRIYGERVEYVRKKGGWVKDSVRIKGEIEGRCDSLFFSRPDSVVWMYGNVKINLENATFSGNEGFYRIKEKKAVLYGDVKYEKLSPETIFITSDTVIYLHSDSSFIFKGNARAKRRDIEAFGGEIFYKDSLALVLENPGMAEKDDTLRGDTLYLFISSGVDSVVAVNGKGIYVEEKGENRVEGRRIVVHIKEGKTEKVVVTGEAEGCYSETESRGTR